ncbi:MAG: DmsC/YnfH family molybdoenzyme membrane anchor subunit [Gammaproteobacteria bacterium]|nr:DmsC/YnfH family molybdoenzyme membrane anchor subunit [Gammaproteobacteria bacterium]
MHPAFSVIFLTTLIGVAQGLFTALLLGQVFDLADANVNFGDNFYTVGALLSLLFCGGGLVASVFHLGHPERGWRAFSQWRTSWLSREVIMLPTFMFFVFLYMVMSFTGASTHSLLLVGLLGLVASFLLFYCTGMIYACLSFLREWATPLTIVNFILFGCASGFSFAAFYAAMAAPELVATFGWFAIVFTIMSLGTRYWTLARNKALKENAKTTTNTATGFRGRVVQRSQGQMGGSYNTREFFHGATESLVQNIKAIFMVLVFPVPVVLLFIGMGSESAFMLFIAFAVQYLGLLAERWYFFAQVNHPQNIYYQTIG